MRRPILRSLSPLPALAALAALAACDGDTAASGPDGASAPDLLTEDAAALGEDATAADAAAPEDTEPPGDSGTADDAAEDDAATSADTAPEDATADTVLPPEQPYALYAGADPSWGLSPWPDDRMRGADGALRLTGFDTNDNEFAIAYKDLVEAEVLGYPRMPVVYFPLSQSPASHAPSDPAASRAPYAPIRIIAFPDDTACAQQVPVEVALFDADSPFLPVPALMATPVHGHELAPLTRYAAVLDAAAATPALARDPAFEAAWSASEGPLAALRGCLGSEAEDVVAATVFTTADSTRELATFVAHVTSEAVPLTALEGWARVDGQSNAAREVWSGTLPMPVYQSGESPYTASGTGGLVTKGDGPEVQRLEAAPITVAWAPGGMAEGRPVLVWVGGTGIRQFGHLGAEPVKAALADGFVVVSMLPQFHGSRAVDGADPVMSTFNYLNPSAGRSVLRQQAIETAYLGRWIRASLAALPSLPGVDTGRLTYGGHSQGALAGSLLAGVSSDYAAWIFGGLGGHMSTTLVERKDYFDIQELVAFAFGEPVDLITRYHPIVQLAQVTGDVVDPASYARLWRGRPGEHAGSHAFVVNASADATTPVRSVDTITTASGSTVTGENPWTFDPFGLGGVSVSDGPFAGNVQAAGGGDLTILSWLFTGGDHFELLDRPEVGRAVASFLRAAFAGEVPVFTRPGAQPAP